MNSYAPDASRRLLAKAADALAQFRLVAGVPPPPETSVRAQLEQERERAVRAEALVSQLQQRVKLLEAEFVRLHDKRKETLRRLAARAALDAEAASRAVVETLTGRVERMAASLDRAAAESARVKTETEDLRKSLESAVLAQRSLELEKRLEFAHAAGDASAMAMESQRVSAVAAALRLELDSACAAAQQQEEALRRTVAALQNELASARAAASAAAEEVERAQAVASVMATELERAQVLATAATIAALPCEPPLPPSEVGGSLPMGPSLEVVLDPGWARLLRLVRPPVEAAYAHLRRLSATALTAGQNAVLRMSAASIAQACDALTTIELSLEEGPAPGPAAPALPALEMSLAAWEPAFRRRGVTLARDFSSGSLPDAAHDAKALRVMLYHVFRNALEALPRGGRLAVRAGRGPDGGLRLEFVDDGPGFPQAWLDRCFEPFAVPRRGRAGLGLSLVRRTLRRWGGDAEASNGPSGRGAHLTLIFAPVAAS